jgi:hypothetical protein
MKYNTYIKVRKICLIIIAPFVILYIGGFLEIKNWIKTISELHDKAHKENKTSEWFAKKCVSLYLKVALFSIINIISWCVTLYLIIN